MAASYSKNIPRRKAAADIPVTVAIPGREAEMTRNNTGGMTFKISIWDQLHRFLVLGARADTYYENQSKIASRNTKVAKDCLKADGRKTVDLIVEISESGRALKNDEALLALAVAAAHDCPETRKYALASLPRVARIPTHLFDFLTYVEGFRGWGKGLRKAVANWYESKNLRNAAYQMVKYRQRNGWAHRDVLRKAHINTSDEARSALYALACNGFKASFDSEGRIVTERRLRKGNKSAAVTTQPIVLPGTDDFRIVEGFLKAQSADNVGDVIRIVEDHRLTQEMIPTQFLSDAKVQEHLFQSMPLGATIRNLGKLTSLGILSSMSDNIDVLADRMAMEGLKKARIHPITILNALAVYKTGGENHALKGKMRWTPVQKIIDLLDDAFYDAFGAIEPTGKRIVMALDVSGSMGWSYASGCPLLSARQIVAALAMATARVEKKYEFIGFCHHVTPLDISPRMRLDTVIGKLSNLEFGATNPGAAIGWASKRGVKADAFVVYTDGEVNCGRHVKPLLDVYRRSTGLETRLFVGATTATPMSIADPNDRGMLDMPGFDAATPRILSEFISGNI